jgi:serine/threonine-protein kinase
VADVPRVQQLLDEIMDAGRTPEDVCGDCPELLPEVRGRWHQMCAVEAELDAMFPTPGPRPGGAAFSPWQAGAELPPISGYEIETLLGHGGMGIVYRARHLRLNRLVALKMMIAGAYAGPHERARFQREAEAVARLRHANIVQVYDVGDHEGWPYYTMELLEGGSLSQALAGTPQPARQAAALLITLAEAMREAHQIGIVHRDLKPANVLLAADGTPKIADFGLARQVGEQPLLTMSGARVGTPSYMAPEQAAGRPGRIGPAADIYALGALLYETLTGRPPFRAETAEETERQVIEEDPVPPSRLNAKVPRDLETICLKCLHKSPERRYATAAALAEDLKRFQQDLPIAARPVGLFERAFKWVRRHPAPAGTVAASLLLAVMIAAVSLWLTVQKARRREAVQADFKDFARLQASARWAEARAALNRAEARLEGSIPSDLGRRLAQARRDLYLVIQLDAIRLKRVTRGELAFYKSQAEHDYQAAFEQAGLGTLRDLPEHVAGAIDVSMVRDALVTAVYDWAVCAAAAEDRHWLLAVARQANPSTAGWPQRVLVPAVWDDPKALADLARTVPVEQSVSLLLALGERLRTTGGDAGSFLKRVQNEHPADFWVNLIVGNAVLQSAPQEAAGYYRAALAIRPAAAVGYCALGDTLRLQNRLDEAIELYEKAIEVDPGYARAHSNLGLALQARNRLDEAIDCYRKALQFDPDYAWAHHNLATALRATGQFQEAYDHYQQVLRVDPKNPEVHHGLASVLLRQGRGQEAQLDWRKALEANPPDHSAWLGYPELCMFLGQPAEYRRIRRALLNQFGASRDPYVTESVGRACLLLPATEDDLRKATALTDCAVAAKASTADWIYRYFLFAKGLAEYRSGRYDAAISLMEGQARAVMGPCPRLITAMSQYCRGEKKPARKTLAMAVSSVDWGASQADNRDVMVCHILRREAECLILPGLPAFLRGEYQPQDNDERLAMVGACQFQGRYSSAANLYEAAFASEPAVEEHLIADCRSRAAHAGEQSFGRVEELSTQCRYPAAKCAALAGCGAGEDGADRGEAERTHWRSLARRWLRADLVIWAKMRDGLSGAECNLAKKKLVAWQTDPDLAGLREPDRLKTLPAAEREECLAFWKDVSSALKRDLSRQ